MRIDPVLQSHRGWVIAVGAVLPLLACAALAPFTDEIANTTAALVLVLFVVAAAATGIRPAGVLAALTAAAGFDYFLTAPFHAFAISDPADIETAVLLLLVGGAVGELALWGRRQQAAASREQGYLDGVIGTAATVAAGRSSADALADRVCAQITSVLGVDACRFDPATRYGLPTLSEEGVLVRDGRTVDVARRGLPTDTAVALPARAGGLIRGHFLLTASTRVVRPSRNQLRVAVTLANQAAAALAGSAPADVPARPGAG
jgi:K+-sensing histidine kinase KdpD